MVERTETLGKSIKCPALEKMLRLEYQSNDIEKCLALFMIHLVRFNNLPSFDLPFLLVEMGDILRKNPFRKPTKTSENNKRDFALFPFLAIMTLGCVHVFCPLGRMESP